MLPVYEEKGVYNFYMKVGKQEDIAPLEAPKKLEEFSKDELVKLIKEMKSKQGKAAPGGPRQPWKV